MSEMRTGIFLAIMTLLSLSSVHADERIVLDDTVITGNTELPKVLYIIPWKRPEMKTLPQPLELHSVFEEVLRPVSQDEYQRFLQHRAAATAGGEQ